MDAEKLARDIVERVIERIENDGTLDALEYDRARVYIAIVLTTARNAGLERAAEIAEERQKHFADVLDRTIERGEEWLRWNARAQSAKDIAQAIRREIK